MPKGTPSARREERHQAGQPPPAPWCQGCPCQGTRAAAADLGIVHGLGGSFFAPARGQSRGSTWGQGACGSKPRALGAALAGALSIGAIAIHTAARSPAATPIGRWQLCRLVGWHLCSLKVARAGRPPADRRLIPMQATGHPPPRNLTNSPCNLANLAANLANSPGKLTTGGAKA